MSAGRFLDALHYRIWKSQWANVSKVHNQFAHRFIYVQHQVIHLSRYRYPESLLTRARALLYMNLKCLIGLGFTLIIIIVISSLFYSLLSLLLLFFVGGGGVKVNRWKSGSVLIKAAVKMPLPSPQRVNAKTFVIHCWPVTDYFGG